MRLLSVIPVMGVGGAEVVAATLAVDARARGHHVAMASAGGFRVAEVERAGVAHHHVPMDSRDPVDLARSVAALRRVVREHAPDVVHAHNVKAALVARLAVGRRMPLLTTLHGVPDRELATGARLLRRTTDRLVAVSASVAEQVADHGFPGDRLSLVENAVSPPRLPDRTTARARLGLPGDQVVGLCLARFAEQKRHDLLVAAWEQLPAGGALLLAGDGPTRSRVEALVAGSRRPEEIRVLGPRTDVPDLLAAADYLVLPTDWEGLPISVLEAMSVGLPVVASRVGGVLETLGEGVRLVAPGSVAALRAGLREVGGSAAARSALGERGRRLVRERYRTDVMLDAYAAEYDETLFAPPTTPPSTPPTAPPSAPTVGAQR